MRKWFFILATSILLTACTQDSFSSDTGDNTSRCRSQIDFKQGSNNSYIEAESVTRASQITASTMTSFGVTCSYYPKKDSYTSAKCGSYFYNVVIDPSDGKSGYYWPGTDYRLSFFAYTPCGNSYVYLLSTKEDTGMPKYYYAIPEDVKDQVDFMTCNVLDHEGLSFTPIPLSFSHKCSEVRFSAVNNSPEDLVLKSISIIGTKYKGTLSNDSWMLEGTANTLSEHPFAYSPEVTVESTKTVDVTGTENHFILLPQTVSKGTGLIVVKTVEDGEEHTYTYTLPEDLTFSEGKSYVFNLRLGYKTLAIEKVEIADWEDETNLNGELRWYEPAESKPIDLGLPSGTKWAAGNLGATNNYDYGDYYAWGEITTKSSYTEDNYTASAATGDIAGTAYDAAYKKLGGSWKMPTKAQCSELISGTYNGWTNDYNGTGVKGYIFYKKVSGKESFSAYSLSDTHIFMPAAGGYNTSASVYGAGSDGVYWSSTYSYSDYAFLFTFNSGSCTTNSNKRIYGRPIRAVCQ